MRPGERWIRDRLPDAPAELLQEMIGALPERAPTDADALAEAAISLYSRVLQGSGAREDALPLLAADALLTHAHQACAESDPSALEAFAERWGGAGRLGEVAG